MRLVLDTNILLSALITDSETRRVILRGEHEFYYPKDSLREIRKYEDLILKKSGLVEKELNILLSMLLKRIELVDAPHFSHKFKEAERLMTGIDPKDAIFVALALSIPDCKIWSNDNHLHSQKKIAALKTNAVLKI